MVYVSDRISNLYAVPDLPTPERAAGEDSILDLIRFELSPDSLTEEERARRIRQREARGSLLDFTTYTYADDEDIAAGMEFDVNWHHRVICDALDKLYNREIRRLILTMPPGHSKSELGSRRFPAQVLGKDPNHRIIATSYNATMASDFNRDVQRVITSDLYRDVFPATTLNDKNIRTVAGDRMTYLRNSEVFEIVGHRGYYKSAGRGSAITGRRFDIGIIDDPLKGREEAESKVIRDSCWDWYKNDFWTRQAPNAVILIICTRWHHDDLVGRLLKEAERNPNADQWVVINLPAVMDRDSLPEKSENDPRVLNECLWPNQYGHDYYAGVKDDPYIWNSLFQQRPTPRGGGMIKRAWYRSYTQMPQAFDRIIQSWDTAQKKGRDDLTNSHWCGLTIGEIGQDIYLLDMQLDRYNQPEGIEKIGANAARFRPNALLIEDKSSGSGAIQYLSSGYEDEGTGEMLYFNIIGIQPEGDKIARMSVESPAIQGGRLLIPDAEHFPHYAWIPRFIEHTCGYPRTAIMDVADALSQLLKWIRLNPIVILGSDEISTGSPRSSAQLVDRLERGRRGRIPGRRGR